MGKGRPQGGVEGLGGGLCIGSQAWFGQQNAECLGQCTAYSKVSRTDWYAQHMLRSAYQGLLPVHLCQVFGSLPVLDCLLQRRLQFADLFCQASLHFLPPSCNVMQG